MLQEIEKKFNYSFKDKELLTTALIHKSYNEGLKKDLPDNEKLEFLGDSVINLVITGYLFKRFQNLNEGELSKLKAHLVSSEYLYEIANSLQLNEYIHLGKGEEKNNGRNNKKIISSLFEALVGAIYLDSNFSFVSTIIIAFYRDFLEKYLEKEIKINDYKSELQEIIQKNHSILPIYKIFSISGSAPNITFQVAVFLNDKEIGLGEGKNKRAAEQNAAFNALKKNNGFINYEKLSEVFFLKND